MAETTKFPTGALGLVSLLVVAMIIAATPSQDVVFDRFFAGLPPPFAAALVCVVGIGTLSVLYRRYAFQISAQTGAGPRFVAMGLAVPFMFSVTFADLILGFPQDTNVAMPMALLFYPAMGAIAQLALHIIPFTILLLSLDLSGDRLLRNRKIWIAIFLVSVIEAVFQVTASMPGGGAMGPLNLFVAIQLFLFGVTELYLFWRYDLVAMYLFRITYYGWWHILWAAVRPFGSE